MKISLRSKLAKKLIPFLQIGVGKSRLFAKASRRVAGAVILTGGLSFLGAAREAPAVELIENGSFEMNDGFDGDNEGFGWLNPDGPPIFDVYSHTTQIYYEGPAPDGAGDWYFHTVGVANSEDVFQDVDLTTAATPAQIDAGTVGFNLSGWLSGYTLQNDHPDLVLRIFDEAGDAIGTPLVFDGADFGPNSFFVTTVTGADPSTFANPIAAWKQYQAERGVFVGARTARVTIVSDSLTGNGNDNYADLISFDVADTGVPQFLAAKVNTTTGVVSMVNDTSDSVAINFYELRSPSGSLSVNGWNSFDDQDLDAFGPNPGESWTEGGGSDEFLLVEAFLSGTTTFAAGGGANTLGNAYNPVPAAQDLDFFYAGLDGQLVRGIVEYFAGISGDFDGNGDFACADIDALVTEIVAGTNNTTFDLTGDGLVDLGDRDAWLTEAGAAELASGNPYQLGDANLDGVTDVPDFIIWNGNKFTADNGWCGGDFNADGVTDVPDFIIWNGNKFTAADGVSAVPEPSFSLWGLVMLATGAAFGIRRRRT